MSDTPTHATGVLIQGAHAYLYNRNGTFIADAALAGELLAAFDLAPADAKRLAVSWLGTIGYRLADDGGTWTEHHGSMRAVEYIGVPAKEGDGPAPAPAPAADNYPDTTAGRIARKAAYHGWVDEWARSWAARGTGAHTVKYTLGVFVLYIEFDRGGRIHTATAYNGPTDDHRIADVGPRTKGAYGIVARMLAEYAAVSA